MKCNSSSVLLKKNPKIVNSVRHFAKFAVGKTVVLYCLFLYCQDMQLHSFHLKFDLYWSSDMVFTIYQVGRIHSTVIVNKHIFVRMEKHCRYIFRKKTASDQAISHCYITFSNYKLICFAFTYVYLYQIIEHILPVVITVQVEKNSRWNFILENTIVS